MRYSINKIILLIPIIWFMFASCDSQIRDPKDDQDIFGSINTVLCSCNEKNKSIMFSNFQFSPKRVKIKGRFYSKLVSENAMKIKGFLRREHQLIYFMSDVYDSSEQKLFDFNAKNGDYWQVFYQGQRIDKYTFLGSNYDKLIGDTLFLFSVKPIKFLQPQPSHRMSLAYVQIGKERGIIMCVYTAYNGYIVRQFYPECNQHDLSFQESIELDKKWGGHD